METIRDDFMMVRFLWLKKTCHKSLIEFLIARFPNHEQPSAHQQPFAKAVLPNEILVKGGGG